MSLSARRFSGVVAQCRAAVPRLAPAHPNSEAPSLRAPIARPGAMPDESHPALESARLGTADARARPPRDRCAGASSAPPRWRGMRDDPRHPLRSARRALPPGAVHDRIRPASNPKQPRSARPPKTREHLRRAPRRGATPERHLTPRTDSPRAAFLIEKLSGGELAASLPGQRSIKAGIGGRARRRESPPGERKHSCRHRRVRRTAARRRELRDDLPTVRHEHRLARTDAPKVLTEAVLELSDAYSSHDSNVAS